MIFSEPFVWTLISLISGSVGAAIYVRAKAIETAQSLKEHMAKDLEQHVSVTDRLGRIETKIDFLLEGKVK